MLLLIDMLVKEMRAPQPSGPRGDPLPRGTTRGTREPRKSSLECGSAPHTSVCLLSLFDTISQHMGTCFHVRGQKGERQWVSRSESLRKLTESFGSGLRPDPLNPRACATRARRKEQALPAAARPPRARPGRFASGDLQLRGPSARSSTESSVYRVWFRQAIHFVLRSSSQSRWVA